MSFIINNDIYNNDIRQENYLTNFKVPISIEFLKEKFQKKVNGKLSGVSQVLNQLLFRYNNKWSMTISQKAIATQSKLSRLHTGDILRYLEGIGVIRVVRCKRRNSTYILNQILFDPQVRFALRHRIPEMNDERTSKRSYYGGVILCSKEAQNYLYKSDLNEAYKNQKSITIYNDISYQETIDLTSPYIPYNFDSDDIDISFHEKVSSSNEEKTLKGSSSMQDLYSEILIPYLDQIKSIRPTLWGQIKLSAYPKEVVIHADQVTLKHKKKLDTAQSRWKYLMGVCAIYCRENKIETSWPMAIQMGRELEMPDEGPFFDDTHQLIPDKVSISKKRSNLNPYQYNQDIIQEWGPHLDKELYKKKTHEEEWEFARINDPEKFARWEANAKQFRQMLGLNEDGTFKEGRTAQQAVDLLGGIFT